MCLTPCQPTCLCAFRLCLQTRPLPGNNLFTLSLILFFFFFKAWLSSLLQKSFPAAKASLLPSLLPCLTTVRSRPPRHVGGPHGQPPCCPSLHTLQCLLLREWTFCFVWGLAFSCCWGKTSAYHMEDLLPHAHHFESGNISSYLKPEIGRGVEARWHL